jgi:hypothetical protein
MVVLVKPRLEEDNFLNVEVSKPDPVAAQELVKIAEVEAGEGEVQSMDPLLRIARMCGADLQKLNEIRKRGYEKALERELNNARNYIREGRGSWARIALRFADEYALRLGKNIKAEYKELFNIAAELP